MIQNSYLLAKDGTGLGKVMPGLRLALTGAAGGPDLMQIISILGPKETAERIEYAIDTIK
jgi:glutamyl-tRNA synthetase